MTPGAWVIGVREYALELIENLEALCWDGYFSQDDLADKSKVKNGPAERGGGLEGV